MATNTTISENTAISPQFQAKVARSLEEPILANF